MKINKEMIKDFSVKVIAVSLGYVTVTILWAIGIQLVFDKIYVGIIPIVIGYELLRIIVKLNWKILNEKF